MSTRKAEMRHQMVKWHVSTVGLGELFTEFNIHVKPASQPKQIVHAAVKCLGWEYQQNPHRMMIEPGDGFVRVAIDNGGTMTIKRV